MFEIDIQELLTELLMYLPQGADSIPEPLMVVAIERVVSNVGVSEENLPKIKCDSLKAIAEISKSLTLTQGNVKREEVFQEEVEYFNNYDRSIWDEFIASLDKLCPAAFGYYPSSKHAGAYINVAVQVEAPTGSPPYGSQEWVDERNGVPRVHDKY